MAQGNVALLLRYAGTTAADRRARIRAEKFTTLRRGITEAFAIPLIPERPRKRSRDSLDGPFEEVLAERLSN